MRRSRSVALTLFAGAALAVMGQPAAAESPAPSAAAREAMQLLESGDAYQQQVGFLRLEALREPATAELIRPYANHNDRELRAGAYRALAAIQGPAAVPFLLERLNTERVPRVRRAMLTALEPLRPHDTAITEALLAALRDRAPEVRMAAVDIVSRIEEPRAQEALRARLRRERHRDVRRVLSLAKDRLGWE